MLEYRGSSASFLGFLLGSSLNYIYFYCFYQDDSVSKEWGPKVRRYICATARDSRSCQTSIFKLLSGFCWYEGWVASLQLFEIFIKHIHSWYFLFFKPNLLGHLERIGSELAHSKSSKESSPLQNGYSHELKEKSVSDVPGSVVDPHQQLLIVLSNIGYCKDELSYELYNKYKHIWRQSR